MRKLLTGPVAARSCATPPGNGTGAGVEDGSRSYSKCTSLASNKLVYLAHRESERDHRAFLSREEEGIAACGKKAQSVETSSMFFNRSPGEQGKRPERS